MCRFGSIVNIKRGASPRPIKKHLTDSSDGVNWIKIGDTLPGEIYINSTNQKIKKESVKDSVYLKKGTLILSNSMSFGRPYILNIDGCIHDGWLAIEIYCNSINIEFLQYILQGYMWYFKSKASGSGVNNLNIDRVSEMPFALPPYNEQKRILKKLRKFDEIFKKINTEYDELEKYVHMSKLKILEAYFGDDSSYKSYYQHEANNLQNICAKITKGSTPTTYGFNFLNEGISFIKVENVKNYRIDNKSINCYISNEANEFQKRSQLKENDILFSIAGTIGRTCIVTKEDLPANTNQAFAILSEYKKITPKYLLFFLEYSKLLVDSHGAGMLNATLTGIKKIKI